MGLGKWFVFSGVLTAGLISAVSLPSFALDPATGSGAGLDEAGARGAAAVSSGKKLKAAAGPAVEGKAAARLPVRKVALYKNGIGFFEHRGSVSGNEAVTINFTTAQLNDVLQTLTAIDLNGGHIAGAGYNSTTPFEQQLKALPLALGADPTAADFYGAIRGARIEVHSGGAVFVGRLLNIEVHDAVAGKASDKDSDTPAPSVERRYITVVGDTGVVRTFELNSSTEVRLLDSDLHQDVARYLQLLANTRNQGLRHLTLQADGVGTRELRVSYISEVPVWKCTYRVLFSDQAKADGLANTATLQGWAVVDNTVGTDWENVELSLIAGAPQSFIQPISQPYYTRRPEVPLPEDAQLTPQTHESGDEDTKDSTISTEQVSNMPLAGRSLNGAVHGGAMGQGAGLGRMQTLGSAAAPAAMSYEDSATASTVAKTTISAFDDYFEYKLADPITIRKNESALVPILQTKVDAKRVTLWSPSEPQALRALWVTNTSDLTLDRGSFSILEDGRFAGEGLLEVIHPKERRLLSYAADQAVRVSTEGEHNVRRVQQIAVSKGILTERTEEVNDREYVVHNAAPEARDVIVEHPRAAGWELDSKVKPTETTSNAYRFDVEAKAGETVRLHVGERHTISQRYELATLNDSQLGMLLRTDGDGSAIQQRVRDQLAPIFEAKHRVADLDAQLAAKQAAIDEIGNDQKRLRDNLAALKGSAEERALVRRYTDEMNGQEDRLATLRKEQEDLRAQRVTAERELSIKIQALQLDEAAG
ncbi:MAG TPA: DUF4139 domain-containing protein [Acidisarcina sp.]